MSATQRLMGLDRKKKIVPFGDGTEHQFSHADCLDIGDPTGISIEEGEFVYGLVRMTLPKNILETGTNIGVSASYMALAMSDNGFGNLTTIEHDGTVANRAIMKFRQMGFSSIVHVVHNEVSNFKKSIGDKQFDMFWLDSELNQRYRELIDFYPNLAPGGLACIHDLWGLDFTEFGGLPEELRTMLKNGDLRVLTFKTNHGVTVFQKRREKDYLADLLKGIV